MASGEEPRSGSFDYDYGNPEDGPDPRREPNPRYVNADTIMETDLDYSGQGHDNQETIETNFDDPEPITERPENKKGHQSSDEEKDPSKSSSSRMSKLFGKKQKTENKSKEKKDKANKKKERKSKKDEITTSSTEKKEKPREKSPHRMPGFGKLGGFFKRNKKDSNTSNDSDITPPKQTSTPPSRHHDGYESNPPRDISSEGQHDHTYPHSEHSGATSAAANSDVFDEPDKAQVDEMDPRTRFRGPPPESIPMAVPTNMAEPSPEYGWVNRQPSAKHTPLLGDATAAKTVPYSEPAAKPSLSSKIKAPINKLLADKREPTFKQGEGIAELKPKPVSSTVRCSTFIVFVLISGFILGIILTALGSMNTTMSIVGPCFIGLSLFGLIGKIFFTLWWEDDPLPPLHKVNNKFHAFMEDGPNYKMQAADIPMQYPVRSSQPIETTYGVQNEGRPLVMETTFASDDVPDIGGVLTYTDSDMESLPRDSRAAMMYAEPIDRHQPRIREESISSEENINPTFI